MRFQLCGLVISLISVMAAPVFAEERHPVVRHGLMCISPDALAALTRPDGSARDDASAAMKGGCKALMPGSVLTLETQRRNTSIAVVSGQRYVVPNIDLGAKLSSACVNPSEIKSVTGTISRQTFQSEDHGTWNYFKIDLSAPLCILSDSAGTIAFDSAELDISAVRPNLLVVGTQQTLGGNIRENDVGEHPTLATLVVKSVR